VSDTTTERMVGLIGYPLRHSISPAFQQAAFDACGLAVRYTLWETRPDKTDGLGARLRQPDVLGANVTIPYKQLVLAFLDAVDPLAVAVGAVNTIAHRAGRLEGFNSDVYGFVEAVRRDAGASLTDRRVLVLGAGGAARSVAAAALGERAAEIVVSARRAEQAAALVGHFQRSLLGDPRTLRAETFGPGNIPDRRATFGADVIVNATPIGTAHRPDDTLSLVDPVGLRPDQLVVDLVYNPPETPLLRAARDRGASTLNGLPMLVYQGAKAFEIWTGQSAPVALMRRVAGEALGA
jgi:shikimate dehydrogenase